MEALSGLPLGATDSRFVDPGSVHLDPYSVHVYRQLSVDMYIIWALRPHTQFFAFKEPKMTSPGD